MDDIDEFLEATRALYASLEQLKQISGPELLLPGRVERYRRTLEDAYTAFSQVETRVDALGQQLEYEHQRLDLAARQYGPGDVSTEE